MKHQLQTIRHHLEPLTNNSGVRKALTALAQIEAAVGEQEPVAWCPALTYPGHEKDRAWSNGKPRKEDIEYWTLNGKGITYAYAAPVAQQSQAEDISAFLRSEREGWEEREPKTQAEAVPTDTERAYLIGFADGKQAQQAEAVPTQGHFEADITMYYKSADLTLDATQEAYKSKWTQAAFCGWQARHLSAFSYPQLSQTAPPQQAEAVQKDHPLYVFATEVIHGAYRYTELPAKAKAAIDAAIAPLEGGM